MKCIRQLVIIISCFLVIIACHATSPIPNGFYSYEKEKVKEAVEKLEFEPELPAFVPVEAEILVTDRFYHEGKEAFDMTLFTSEQDIFTVQCVNGESFKEGKHLEEIVITDNVDGFYIDQEYSQSIQWKKEGISYQLTYRPSSEKLPIEKLVKVAASF